MKPHSSKQVPSTSSNINILQEDLNSDCELLSESDDDNILGGEQERSLTPIFNRNLSIAEKSPYESLDYEICENELWKLEQKNYRDPKFVMKKGFARWLVFVVIGILTGLIASVIDIVIEELSTIKYEILKNSVDDNMVDGNLVIPYLEWIVFNMVPVLIGSALVTYVEPIAAGSGIPQVKCYLNGVKIPRLVRIKTLTVKAVGVITSVVGGLAGGKEGPMIHCGAVVAAGISQGKSTTFRRDFKILKYFRDDHEKRDFVVGGAAAGVSAAFGAPIGGLLFSLEEGASFWNQSLIWRTLISSVISSFTLNIVLSAYHGMNNFHYPGLFNLGAFEPLPFEYFELPIFVIIGMIGGLLGAMWNSINIRITTFRNFRIKQKWAKVVETMCIAGLCATVACTMIYLIHDCRSLGNDPIRSPINLFCGDNEYNVAASLWFQTPESSVKSLFHDPPGSHRILTLAVFVLIYFPLSCITFGMNVSLGIFIPTLLVGAAWGRLLAMTGLYFFPEAAFIHPGKYALLGAAAQLGGVVRMTISLSVILIETTGNITFALPLIITLISAKWMGDYFNEGIYDSLISFAKVPMLPWSLPVDYGLLYAEDIMNKPVVCIRLKESASYIYDILKKYSHNGFPVVDHVQNNDKGGRLRGFMLRSQLITILKQQWFDEKENLWKKDVSIEVFRKEYPRYRSIKDIKWHNDKINYTINSEIFMNPSPKCVLGCDSVERVFQSFRALGLRHIVVVDLDNHVQGIITRKDFIRH